jgi:hypothetical protein
LDQIAAENPACAPIILGQPRDASAHFDPMGKEKPVEPILRCASKIDVKSWFAERVAEKQRDCEEWQGFPEPDVRGLWPDHIAPMHNLYTLDERYSENGKQLVRPHREILIALLPSSEPAEAPAFLNFGGWNDCPGPEVHVALARRWADQYGARLVVCSNDTLEFRVKRPVASREEALRLAEEQYTYCEDIVVQGIETIEGLAAALLGASKWFFWWD